MVMHVWPVGDSLVQNTAIGVLALIAGTGALAKLIQRSSFNPDSPPSVFVRLSRSSGFIVVQLAACAALLLPLPAYAHLGAAFVVLAVVISGQVIRLISSERTCDCFGSLTPASSVGLWGITLLSLLAVACIVLRAIQLPSETFDFSIWTPVVAIAVLLVSVLKLRYDAFANNYFVAKYASGESPQSLPPDFELGRTADGGRVTIADALDGHVAMVVVALSATCESCHQLYEDIKAFVNQTDGRMRLILVANHPVVYADPKSSHLVQLIDKEVALGRYLHMSGTPFAALVNDGLELLAPPSKGRDQVRALLNLTLHLLPAEAA